MSDESKTLSKKQKRLKRFSHNIRAIMAKIGWLVENIITLTFSILTKFDIKFLENAWGFHRGVT